MLGKGGGCAVLITTVRASAFPELFREINGTGVDLHIPRIRTAINSHNGLPDDTNKLHCIDYVRHTGLFYTSRSW